MTDMADEQEQEQQNRGIGTAKAPTPETPEPDFMEEAERLRALAADRLRHQVARVVSSTGRLADDREQLRRIVRGAVEVGIPRDAVAEIIGASVSSVNTMIQLVKQEDEALIDRDRDD